MEVDGEAALEYSNLKERTCFCLAATTLLGLSRSAIINRFGVAVSLPRPLQTEVGSSLQSFSRV